MVFNSFGFALFFLFVFIVYWTVPKTKQWLVILVANCVFVSFFGITCFLSLLFISILSYAIGLCIGRKKKVYFLGIGFCITILFIFKYFNYYYDLFNNLISMSITTKELVIPIGISFYTFEAISYMTDIYNGKIEAERNYLKYLCYLSFFPTFSSGPIERYKNISKQIEKEKQFDYNKSVYGVKLLAWGLYKKVVIADNLAPYVDLVFANISMYKGFVFVVTAVIYSFQIYCDFSGYSDMAIGISNMLGFDLTRNFNLPYFSTTIKEYWNRWHISLSLWLKDYIYIPLGGNRCSKLRQYFNVIITFTISGLWHGSNATYLVWGLLHALGQIIERVFDIKPEETLSVKRFIKMISTFIFITITWIIFRANNLNDVMYIFKNVLVGISNPVNYILLGFSEININTKALRKLFFIIMPLFFYDVIDYRKDTINETAKLPWLFRQTIYILIIVMILFYNGVNNASFVYFKF